VQSGQTAWHLAARHGHAHVLEAMINSIVYTKGGPAQICPLLKLGNSTQRIIQRLINVRRAPSSAAASVAPSVLGDETWA
jgi:hypothetical protein